MLNKLLKSLLVICGTIVFTAFLGIIFFSKTFAAMLPESLTGLLYPGLAVTAIGIGCHYLAVFHFFHTHACGRFRREHFE